MAYAFFMIALYSNHDIDRDTFEPLETFIKPYTTH